MAAKPCPTKGLLPGKKLSGWLKEISDLLCVFPKAPEALESLVELKCSRLEIFTMLQPIRKPSFIRDDWSSMLGMTKRRIPAVIKQLRNCANRIERINGQPLTHVLRHSGNWLKVFDHLPHFLRQYALELEGNLKWAGPKKHPARDAAKGALVDYVKSTTGKPRHKEVSLLIAAVLKNDTYGSLDHRMRYRKYSKKLVHYQRP